MIQRLSLAAKEYVGRIMDSCMRGEGRKFTFLINCCIKVFFSLFFFQKDCKIDQETHKSKI